VQKSVLLHELQKEIQRHDLSTFVDEPPSAAQGGKGVTVPGCLYCRKRFGTIAQFLSGVIAAIIAALSFMGVELYRINGHLGELDGLKEKVTKVGTGLRKSAQVSQFPSQLAYVAYVS
jgi:hypothetical protein